MEDLSTKQEVKFLENRDCVLFSSNVMEGCSRSFNTPVDEFLTPLSTPPDEDEFERMLNAASLSYENEDMKALKEKFYER